MPGHGTLVNSFRISPEDLERIGGKPHAAKFPDAAGGGYIGFMEVLHQLHCIVRPRNSSENVFSRIHYL